MKQFISMKLTKSIFLLLFFVFVASCTEKDLYNNDEEARKSQLPSEDSFFGFEMWKDVKLDVNYGVSNFVANVEVYSENPVELKNGSYVKKEGLRSIYSAYTKDGKLSVKMHVSTAVTEAYLYTERLGLPRCVKLETTAEGFTFDATKVQTVTRALTRTGAALGVINNQIPYQLAPEGRTDNIYSLCTWDANGKPTTPNYLSTVTANLDGLTSRIEAFLNQNRAQNNNKNENLRRDAKDLNIKIPAGGSTVEVTFIDENGQYENVFGYYYYKTGTQLTTRKQYYEQHKYVIFPNAINESRALKCGDTAKLLFFGDDGKSTPTEMFPEGYTVGWFLISDGAPFDIKTNNIRQIDQLYTTWDNQRSRNICFSDESGDDRQFITLYDEATKILVVGVEDQFGINGVGDNDFDDVMFCVKTSADINSGDLPVIPDENPEIKPGTEIIEGTLAFEDNWPQKGDYDMNDVIIEYKRIITYDKSNFATQIEESFTPVQRENAATYNNMFAYQVNQMGKVTLPAGCEMENESKSIVISQGVKDIRNQTFTIIRTFDSQIDKDDVKTDFNPYIIIKGIRDSKRAEVHLPKYWPTALADRSQLYTNSDAFFIDKDGKYPFAINLPVTGFKPADETQKIDSQGQYPSFKTWVDSYGEKAKDWYLKDKGAN